MLKLILGILFIASTSKTEPLKDALDGMQAFMNSQNPSFDSEFYQELVTCLNFLDPRLLTSVGAQWDGMIEYAGTQGAPNDTWASCPDTKWFEYNCTVQAYGSMPIYEPCNYASNIAYYHTATEICAREHWHLPEIHVKAMGMNFAILAQGSAFFHGSETSNGGAADVIINDLFAYVAFQAAFEGTVTSNDNPIIHDLSLEPRSKSGAEVTSDFIDMYINVPVEEWGDLLESADVPNLRLTMCGYFSTVLTLLYPPEMVDEIVDYLLGQFTDMTEDIKVFCLQEFLPEIRNVVTKNQTLPHNEWLAFEGNTFSTLIKLLYAFLWQEEVLTTDDIWLQPITNELGMLALPLINGIGNRLNNFTYKDPLMQAGINMYPGEEWCNLVIPHAKWHVETGIALTDFSFLSDELYRILNTYY